MAGYNPDGSRSGYVHWRDEALCQISYAQDSHSLFISVCKRLLTSMLFGRIEFPFPPGHGGEKSRPGGGRLTDGSLLSRHFDFSRSML